MKHTFLHALAVCLSLAALAASAPVRADQDAEREQLSRIDYELERLQAMVADTARQAPSGQRVRFRYDWLQRDLARLKGDYRQ